MRRAGSRPGGRRGRHLGAALGSETGLTLVELLVAMSLTLVVCSATLYFIIVPIDQQNGISSRASATRQAQTGLDQLVRDLGQAMSVSSSGSALSVSLTSNSVAQTVSLVFSIPTAGSDTTAQTVTWTCPSTANASSYVGTCTRTVGTATKTEVNGVQSLQLLGADGSSLSLPATNPAYIGLKLTVQVISQLDHTQPATHIVRGTNGGSDNPVTLQTGVDLRNFA